MRLLCDTQVIVWLMEGDDRMRASSMALLADRTNDVLFSAVSLWEVAIKLQVGKIRTDVAALHENCVSAGMTLLGIETKHLIAVSRLTELFHKDPFDHLLVAQSLVEKVPLLSADRILRRYPIEIIKA